MAKQLSPGGRPTCSPRGFQEGQMMGLGAADGATPWDTYIPCQRVGVHPGCPIPTTHQRALEAGDGSSSELFPSMQETPYRVPAGERQEARLELNPWLLSGSSIG